MTLLQLLNSETGAVRKTSFSLKTCFNPLKQFDILAFSVSLAITLKIKSLKKFLT